ncbi:hypothetical protein SAMN04488574_1852, partial [Bacillus sp. 71mf]
ETSQYDSSFLCMYIKIALIIVNNEPKYRKEETEEFFITV